MQQRLHRVLSTYTFSSATLDQLEDDWQQQQQQQQQAQPEPEPEPESRPHSALSRLGGSAGSLVGGQRAPP